MSTQTWRIIKLSQAKSLQCSKCISSIQELNKDFIEFFLSTQIRSRIKCSPLSLILEPLSCQKEHIFIKRGHKDLRCVKRSIRGLKEQG